MLGTVGEYTVASSNTTDDIIDLIKTYELSCNPTLVPKIFKIKKLGILSTAGGEIDINGKTFTLIKNQSLEFGYGVIDIVSIKCKTAGLKLIIRYLY